MNDSPGSPGYGSARDLPSFKTLQEQIRGFKGLTRFVFREHRPQLEELERSLNNLVTVVDGFYELLGPRNWVFHDWNSPGFSDT